MPLKTYEVKYQRNGRKKVAKILAHSQKDARVKVRNLLVSGDKRLA